MEESPLIDCDESLCELVIQAAIAVHRALGPGLLESVYEKALMIELAERGITAQNQVEISASYRGRDLGLGFRADIIVDNCLLLEIKAVQEFSPAHLAQIMTYQRLLRFKRGYLFNFALARLKDGIKRVSI